MDRVTNISWKTTGGASLGGFAYEYDALGRITSRSHALGTNAFDRVYAYDDLDCLAFGSCSFSVLTIAFSIPQGIARGSSQVVTHWGPGRGDKSIWDCVIRRAANSAQDYCRKSGETDEQANYNARKRGWAVLRRCLKEAPRPN